MKYGFVKVAAAAPKVQVADCAFNVNELISMAAEADRIGVKLLVFPELSLTSYTCGDLFFNEVLLSSAEKALMQYVEATRTYDMISVVGLPLRRFGAVYNGAAVCKGGHILGFVPKSHIPNYGEFYEKRYFEAAGDTLRFADIGGETVPFGTNILFTCASLPAFTLGVEICEDLWVATPPSDALTASGATVIANLSASNETIGKEEYRRRLVKLQSAKTTAGYIYSDAGYGESTTDLVFASHCLICENGSLLAERKPFATPLRATAAERLTVTELDVNMLAGERARLNSAFKNRVSDIVSVPFTIELSETVLTRRYPALPFVPADKGELSDRAETILSIQAAGLCKRMEASRASRCIIGISGGLDSCLALLVAVRACDAADLPRQNILGVTMPCFGTTDRTKNNAELLCKELGVRFRQIAIGASVLSHFHDIGHEESNHNVVYENAQARERTQVLMDLANAENGLVIGTGDLSELALGWATYNGDHMSMYGVNASIPKTLVRYLVRHCAEKAEAESRHALAEVLLDILDTPVSPELLPPDGHEIRQKTEDIVGPYEIHDFYLYYMLRFGFSPKKLYHLATATLSDTFSPDTLLHWLEVFTRRFFAQQYKRSCLPDGPKVGSVGLSPRGDWRMPSDASSALWMAELAELKEEVNAGQA